jgi:hypothetical protein
MKVKVMVEVRHFIARGERASKDSQASPSRPSDKGNVEAKTLELPEAVT